MTFFDDNENLTAKKIVVVEVKEIKRLPEAVVNRVAAGEVRLYKYITRKEERENAVFFFSIFFKIFSFVFFPRAEASLSHPLSLSLSLSLSLTLSHSLSR
jgi:hypothetical protein